MKNVISVTIERDPEDGPSVVVTLRRPTEEEAIAYWQHRQDAEDPKRAAHGGHADSAAEIMAACVTSVVPVRKRGAAAEPPQSPATTTQAEPGLSVGEDGVPFIPFAPGRAGGAAGGTGGHGAVDSGAEGLDAGGGPLLGGGSPGDQFRALREEFPHLPRQLNGRFLNMAGDSLPISDVPASAIPQAVRDRYKGSRLRAVYVDASVRKGPDGKPVKGPDGKPIVDGKLVVMSKLGSSEVEFLDAEAATNRRPTPDAKQLVAVAKAHIVEAPSGLLAEYPLLPLYLGQLLYSAAAAKIGGAQGE